jgi:hypothetical protein
VTDAYEGWAICELMGHRRLAGSVSQAEQYGAVFLRLDVPGPDDTFTTQFYGGGARPGARVGTAAAEGGGGRVPGGRLLRVRARAQRGGRVPGV